MPHGAGSQFIDDVRAGFDLLQTCLRKKRPKYCAATQELVQLVLGGALTSASARDADEVRWALLTLPQWEVFYAAKMPNTNEGLEDARRRLWAEGCAWFGRTGPELQLLQGEVVGRSTRLQEIVQRTAQWEQEFAAEPAWQPARQLLQLYEERGRTDKARQWLASLGGCPGWTVPIHHAMAVAWLGASCSSRELESALRTFTEREEENRLVGIYDPVVYAKAWARVIEDYVAARESAFMDSSPEYEGTTIDDAFDRAAKLVGPAAGVITLSPEFLEIADERLLRLMKKHDELILWVADYDSDDLAGDAYFRGTRLLLQRQRMLQCFPGKLDTLLSDRIDPWTTHPDNVTAKRTCDWALAEFPNEADRIHEALDEPQDEDDSGCTADDDGVDA